MEFKEFRNNTKVFINEELVNSIVEGFLVSNLSFYNSSSSLMACLEQDSSCEGKVDSKENEQFMNLVMLNMCIDKCHGKEAFKSLGHENQVKMGQIFYRKIKKKIFESYQVVYDSTGICENDDYKDMEHEFIIKVAPERFVSTLTTVYKNMRRQGLSDFRIITPSTRFVCIGYNAPIKIRCASKDLDKMITFLNSIESELINDVLPVLQVYDVSSWFGYQQLDFEGKTAPSLLSNAIYEALEIVLDMYITDKVITMPNGVLSSDYYNNAKNKHVAMKNVIIAALASDYDSVMQAIFEITKFKLSDFAINMADCLRFDFVNKKVEEIFGKEIDVQGLFDERVEANREIIRENPNIQMEREINPEEERLNDLVRQAEEDLEKVVQEREEANDSESIIESAAERANLEAQRRIAERKAELEEIVSRGNGFPSGFKTEEDMEQALELIGAKDVINEDPGFASNNYTVKLGESFINVLNGADPEKVSAYHEAADELSDILMEENNPELAAVIKKKNDLDISSADEISSLTKGIDSAIDAIIAMEENEQEQMRMGIIPEQDNKRDFSRLDIPDISRGAKPGFDPNKVVSVSLGNKGVLEGFSSQPENFASGKTEVLTDVVKEVTDKLKETVKDTSSLDIQKPERLAPESNCLDYKTSDSVYIPDLRFISYKDNDLIDALKGGGCETNFEYISEIATHFGLQNYTGTREQNRAILHVLRNLDKTSMDGTLLDGSGYALAYLNPGYVEKPKEEVKEDLVKDVVDFQEQNQVQEEIQYIQPTVQAYDISYETKFRDSFKYKYSQYVPDTKILDEMVAGTTYSVLDYFLYFDVFAQYRSDSVFVLHENGIKIKGKEFTTNYLIPYLVNYGSEDLGTIISYFVEEILPPERKVRK